MDVVDLRDKKTDKQNISPLNKSSETRANQYLLLEWNFQIEKDVEKNWKIGTIIALITLFAFAIWQENYFFSILILIVAFLIFFLPKKEKETYCALLERGARIDKELFPWEGLKSFWIFEEPAEIYFRSKKSYLPFIIMPLPEEYFNEAREILLDFLPEKEAQRNFLDFFSKKIGL